MPQFPEVTLVYDGCLIFLDHSVYQGVCAAIARSRRPDALPHSDPVPKAAQRHLERQYRGWSITIHGQVARLTHREAAAVSEFIEQRCEIKQTRRGRGSRAILKEIPHGYEVILGKA